MKILIASTPLMGHLNPLLAIGYMLINEGHEVVGLSSNALRARIEDIGAEFRAFPAQADLDLRDIAAAFPEIRTYLQGPKCRASIWRRVFIHPIGRTHGPTGGFARLSG